MSSYRIGMNLRVTEDSNQGGRRYMEDRHAIRFVKNDEGGFEFAYFGIFDGHGGGEASKYARDYLIGEITKYDCFWNDIDEDILWAIKSAFIDCHHNMWKDVDRWPKTVRGLPSTAGTTASICIIKNSKLYIGHVGDSAIALGYNNGKTEQIVKPKAMMLTKDHKPEDPNEWKRIETCGGQVVNKSGVLRVVWNRPRTDHRGPIRRSTQIDHIPFLAVARSLGDFWSYNYVKEEFIVSPEPDVSVHKLDSEIHKCLIIGSDGLWNMVTAEEAVNSVFELESQFEQKVINDPSVPLSYWINPAERLVHAALNKWQVKLMKADNTSAIVVLIDPLGPRKLSILKTKREERMKEILGKMSTGNEVSELPAGNENMEKSLKKDVNKKEVTLSSNQKMVTSNPCNGIFHDPVFKTKVLTHLTTVTSLLAVSNIEKNIDDSAQQRSKVSLQQLNDRESLLQTNSNENVCRMGVAMHSSQKSIVSSGIDSMHSSPKKPVVSSIVDSACSSHQKPNVMSSVDSVCKSHQKPNVMSSVDSVRKSRQKPNVMSSVVSVHSSHQKPNVSCSIDMKPANTNIHDLCHKTLHYKSSCASTQVTEVDQHMCLQPSKNTDNVKFTSVNQINSNIRVKDLENLYLTNVNFGVRNLNVKSSKKLDKSVKKVNDSSKGMDYVRSGKKLNTRGPSMRISVRLRQLRQRTLQLKNQVKNKNSLGKANLKRKVNSNQDTATLTSKKIRHF